MNILVIGKNAFLAQNLKNHAFSKQCHFMGFKESLSDSWPEGIGVVINFAYDPIVKEGQFSDFDAKLAQKAKECGAAYVMMSSRAVYGVSDAAQSLTENDQPSELITPYGSAKLQIEKSLLDNFAGITILRPSNIFGYEYSIQKPRTTFMGMLLKTLKEEGAVNFNMSPHTMRDFLSVDIITKHLIKILHKPQAGIYNLGAGFGTQTGDIANWVIEGFGAGTLSTSSDDIIDSFCLDMAHTNATYGLDVITTDDIRAACIKVGKTLQLDS